MGGAVVRIDAYRLTEVPGGFFKAAELDQCARQLEMRSGRTGLFVYSRPQYALDLSDPGEMILYRLDTSATAAGFLVYPHQVSPGTKFAFRYSSLRSRPRPGRVDTFIRPFRITGALLAATFV